MTQEAFEKRIPPPEVVRGALLLGIAVGSSDMGRGPDVRECAECRTQIENIRKSIAMAAQQTAAQQQQRSQPQQPHQPSQPQPPQAPQQPQQPAAPRAAPPQGGPEKAGG
jgi:hypothetical protein